MNPMWLVRASRWARNPPSMRRVLLILGIVAVCLALYGFEQVFGWPEWLTLPNDGRRVPRL